MKVVAHLTTVHQPNDSRIFLKQCSSLASAGFDTRLISATAVNDTKNQVTRIGIGKPKHRLLRMIFSQYQLFKVALKQRADIYHCHDPELLLSALALKLFGKKVIFDLHEDMEMQILHKHYLPSSCRQVIASLYTRFERFVLKRLNGCVVATDYILNKIKSFQPATVAIKNFPIKNELMVENTEQKRQYFTYIGGITKVRGIHEMIQACDQAKVTFCMAGTYFPENLQADLKQLPAWQSVKALGFIPREKVVDYLSQSIAGFVLIHPSDNYKRSLPIKLFEYMAAGIPVIASNFPLWESFILEYQCGLCVDPLDVQAITDAIDYLNTHPDEARAMGERGRKAVLAAINWEQESKKLVDFYQSLLK